MIKKDIFQNTASAESYLYDRSRGVNTCTGLSKRTSTYMTLVSGKTGIFRRSVTPSWLRIWGEIHVNFELASSRPVLSESELRQCNTTVKWANYISTPDYMQIYNPSRVYHDEWLYTIPCPNFSLRDDSGKNTVQKWHPEVTAIAKQK